VMVIMRRVVMPTAVRDVAMATIRAAGHRSASVPRAERRLSAGTRPSPDHLRLRARATLAGQALAGRSALHAHGNAHPAADA
jgi:hypothetical protein